MCDGHYDTISIKDASEAVDGLKSGKRDGSLDLYTDNFIHCSEVVKVILSKLFIVMIKHGYCPKNMLSGTTVPIPKVKGTNSADNYRALTLSNVTVKLMEAIILKKIKNLLNTSNLQYGFKSNMSTTSCTFVVQEVISYYNDHDTPVICTLLDASKAFDRLHFCILFKKLIKRVYLQYLLDFYCIFIKIKHYVFNGMAVNLMILL